MDLIHYSRCRMVPTPSSLAAALGLLDTWDEAGGARVIVEFGDYDHKDDRLWMRHAGSAKSIWARAKGADTRVVALSRYDAAEPIHVRSESGIHSVADLRGKRVAVPRVPGRAFDVDRHVYLMPLASALMSAGLSLADVTLVDTDFERPRVRNPIGPHEARNFFEHAAEIFMQQLLEGTVDAIVTVLPVGHACHDRIRKIYDTRGDPRPTARGELRLLTVSGELLRSHRMVVVEAVARLLQAVHIGLAQPAQTMRHLAQELSISPASLAQRELDLQGWCWVDCTIDQLVLLRARMDMMLATRSIGADFAIDEWVEPSIVIDARELLERRRSRASID
ncbi:MAG TPA: hypothetical protein VFA81_10220 [Burkholderiales bacterium]|nr:hypothetical protein [Burkholderiales bacterium]